MLIMNNNISLNNKNWKEFTFEIIFEINATVSGIDGNKLTRKNGDIPYVTRSNKNNGMDMFVGQQHTKYRHNRGNTITIGLDTQTVFYQSSKFYTGQNIQVLRNKALNRHIALFLIPLVKRQMEKFNWGGNGATITRLKRSKIFLPVSSNGDPDYKFMEGYIHQKEQDKLKAYQTYITQRLSSIEVSNSLIPLAQKKCREFYIKEVSEILSGKDIYETKRKIGHTPYISATAKNNGIGNFISNKNSTQEAGCLSVNRNGSVGYSFYHPYNALFSNDCRKLRLKQPSRLAGIFISQQITQQKEKYGYGYKMGTARLEKQKIMLPTTSENTPDYAYMIEYMRVLEHKKLAAYCKYKGFETNAS